MYKLRADVKIRDEADLDVVTATSTLQNCVASGPDPRTTSSQGAAVLLRKVRSRARRPGSISEGASLWASRRVWSWRAPCRSSRTSTRCTAIAFDKGCYLGQELTARAKFRGQVRRRFMPVALHETEVVHSAARAGRRRTPCPSRRSLWRRPRSAPSSCGRQGRRQVRGRLAGVDGGRRGHEAGLRAVRRGARRPRRGERRARGAVRAAVVA